MSDRGEALHYSADADALMLRGPHALVAFGGWVDAGSGGTGGVRHLISNLHTRKLAEIDPEEFYSFTDTRPLVSIVGAGERAVHWPRGEFHGAVLEHTNDLVLFVAPEPNLKWRTFASVMLDGMQRFGVQSMVCIGSIFGAVPHRGEVRMTGWANNDELRQALARHNVMFTNYEGPTGFVTVLLAEAEARGPTTFRASRTRACRTRCCRPSRRSRASRCSWTTWTAPAGRCCGRSIACCTTSRSCASRWSGCSA
jgi:hypothetical protein